MTIAAIRATILDLTTIIEEAHLINLPPKTVEKHRIYRDKLRTQLRKANNEIPKR